MMKGEIFRRIIHACGIFVPLISIFIGKTSTIGILAALSIIYSISEYLRSKGRTFPIINRITENAIRSGERTSAFAFAPLSLALGVSASLLIFPTPINYASIVIVCVDDVVASTAGGAVGRNRIPYNSSKSVQGTILGMVTAFVVSLLFVSPILALTGSVVGMLVESLPLRLNDNITIPILAGIAMVAVRISGVIS
jgi:dolichol kinase